MGPGVLYRWIRGIMCIFNRVNSFLLELGMRGQFY